MNLPRLGQIIEGDVVIRYLLETLGLPILCRFGVFLQHNGLEAYGSQAFWTENGINTMRRRRFEPQTACAHVVAEGLGDGGASR